MSYTSSHLPNPDQSQKSFCVSARGDYASQDTRAKSFDSQCLSQVSCEDMTRALAARTSNPGGGSAAALVGAAGISLASMAAHFTCGKKDFLSYTEDLNLIISRSNSVREHLLELINEDAHYLEILMDVYKLPRESSVRAEKLEEALNNALESPYAMMLELCCGIDLLSHLVEMCSPMLLSDVGSAALICRAALEAASYNVRINTRSLKNKDRARKIDAEVDEMLAAYTALAEDVARIVRDYMTHGRKPARRRSTPCSEL